MTDNHVGLKRGKVCALFGDNVEFGLEQTLYGHAARVWDAKLLDEYIISVGEVIVYSY